VRLAQAGTAGGAAAASSAVKVKSTRLVGSAINYAYAVKAGPWVFLNGHEAFDFERGLAPEVETGNGAISRPPLRREADYLLRRMRAILKEFGTDLPNAVRVDQFYTKGPAVSAYHLARFAEFGSYIPPSTSIIMERCFTARTNTHTSMIAIVPGPEWTVEKFTLPGQAMLVGLLSQTWDADGMLYLRLACGEPMAYYCSTDTDNLVRQGRDAMASAQRERIYTRLLELLQQRMPLVPLYGVVRLYGAKASINWTPRADDLTFYFEAKPR